MRRTLLGAAAAAALATAAGVAFAQEKQPDQQPPASHRMENGQQGGVGQGQMKEERTGRPAQAQAQAPMAQPGERIREPGQPAKPGTRAEGAGTAAQGEQPQGAERRANQAQSETPNRAEDKKGAQAEKGAQTQERNGQAGKGMQTQDLHGQSEKGMQAQEPSAQSGATPNRQGAAQSRTGQNERQTGQGAAGSGNRQDVQAMGNAHLSHERAATIARTLMATASPQNVHVDVNIGADLPGELDVRPLPPAVIALVPEYRGYNYVVVDDKIVIVEPSTRRVVEIIREGGPTEGMVAPAERINLTADQQRMLLETVRREHVPDTAFEQELDDGATVPPEVALELVPHAVVAEIPMIERYRLFLANDRVVLVDPDTREVVDVIR